MRRLIWLPLAGALLVGGAAVAAAAPDVIDDVATTVAGVPARAGSLLAEVLADLVEQDVISQAQSDAISDALSERVEQERTERQARREAAMALREQLAGFLEDGVLTADEVAQLPEGMLRTALEALLVDGQVTLQQLRELGPFFGGGRGFGPGGPGGHHRGPDS